MSAAVPAAPPRGEAAAVARTGPAATRIERVTTTTDPDTTRVVLDLDGFAEPEVSLLVNQRLVIDVPGTIAPNLPREIPITGDPLVERIRTGQHAAPDLKSRVVIDLKSRADFAVRAQSRRIVVLLAPGGSGAAATAAESLTSGQVLLRAEPGTAARVVATPALLASAPAMAASTPLAEPAIPAPSVELPIAAPPSATPAPEVTLLATAAPRATAPEAADVAARPRASVAVVAVATPTPQAGPAATLDVAMVDAAAPSPSATPFVETAPATTPDGDVPATPSSADAAATTATAAAERTPSTQGKRISIDFRDADVRTVLELIATAGGYQIIFTPDVSGVITITLVDRDWEDALETVLRAKLLRAVRHEDVMLVSPLVRGHEHPRRNSP